MSNIELLLELAIAALTHATEIQALIATAVAEGRDVSDEEVAARKAKAVAAIDKLAANASAP